MAYIQPVPASVYEAVSEARQQLAYQPREMSIARARVLLQWLVDNEDKFNDPPKNLHKRTREKPKEEKTKEAQVDLEDLLLDLSHE